MAQEGQLRRSYACFDGGAVERDEPIGPIISDSIWMDQTGADAEDKLRNRQALGIVLYEHAGAI